MQENSVEIPQNDVENMQNPKNGLTNHNQASTLSDQNKSIEPNWIFMNKAKLLDRYQKYKNKYPKMTEEEIAKKLGISYSTLYIMRKLEGMPIKKSHFSF